MRGATPAQALKDDENPLLRYTQSEKAFEDMQKSQKHADKKRGELIDNRGAFRRPVQGTGLRRGPRAGDPN